MHRFGLRRWTQELIRSCRPEAGRGGAVIEGRVGSRRSLGGLPGVHHRGDDGFDLRRPRPDARSWPAGSSPTCSAVSACPIWTPIPAPIPLRDRGEEIMNGPRRAIDRRCWRWRRWPPWGIGLRRRRPRRPPKGPHRPEAGDGHRGRRRGPARSSGAVDCRSATLKGWEEVTVGAKRFGRVARVRHDIGDRVKPGELLVQFETDRRRARHRPGREAAPGRAGQDRRDPQGGPQSQTPSIDDVDVIQAPLDRPDAQVSLDRARTRT